MRKKTVSMGMALCLMMTGMLAVSGCGYQEADVTKSSAGDTVVIECGGDVETEEFAVSEITAALEENGMSVVSDDGDWTIKLAGIDKRLEEQAFDIKVKNNVITVEGGDAAGLLYGGLEVADMVQLYGTLYAVGTKSQTPYVANRGIKFNAPLDMRTPGYSDMGDSGQMSIADMWDMEFWKEEIDAMARNRYNVLSLWNLNPFPSMVKVKGYEDVALDDV